MGPAPRFGKALPLNPGSEEVSNMFLSKLPIWATACQKSVFGQ